jgi:hypothetical protein
VNELPNRLVVSNFWDATDADRVVSFSPRFSKPGRRPPRLSSEVEEAAASRAANICPDLELYAAQRDLGWLGVSLCILSAVIMVGAVYAFHALVMS